MTIEVRSISKSFGAGHVLHSVDLSVPDGQLVALLGPSGSGKTTLLRIIAGLERADSGQILLHGRDVTDGSIGSRRVGFVFQHYALFGHMTVFENVAFGLRVRPRATRPSPSDIRDKVERLLRLMQLADFGQRSPSALSGGQRQRVALARALAVDPQVLLLDEPFGALDAQVRQELRRWLRLLHEEIHVTSLFVTHDQDEALEVADHVVVMNRGRIEQYDTPDEVYHRPSTEFVMGFLGRVDRFDGRVEGGRIRFGPWTLPAPDSAAGADARVFLRPHDWEIDVHPAHTCAIGARVERIHSAGPVVRLEVVTETGERIQAELSQRRHGVLELRDAMQVFVWPRRFRSFVAGGSPSASEVHAVGGELARDPR